MPSCSHFQLTMPDFFFFFFFEKELCGNRRDHLCVILVTRFFIISHMTCLNNKYR